MRGGHIQVADGADAVLLLRNFEASLSVLQGLVLQLHCFLQSIRHDEVVFDFLQGLEHRLAVGCRGLVGVALRLVDRGARGLSVENLLGKGRT